MAGQIAAIAAATILLAGPISSLIGIVGSLTTMLPLLFTPWGLAIAAVIAAGVLLWQNWDSIKSVASDVATAVSATWQGLADTLSGLWDGIVSYATDAWNTIANAAQIILSPIMAIIDTIKAGLGAVEAAFSSDNQPSGFASGGYVRGPGSSTSDSIPARLSAGEFVVRAAAVRQVGTAFLHRVNSGIARFSEGGLALPSLMPAQQSPALAFASSAQSAPSSSGKVPVHVHFGGETYQLETSDSVASKLTRAAIDRVTRRTGREPSWRS
jgi:hypothetical protein